MEAVVFSAQETAVILDIPVSAVYRLKDDGKLKRLKDLPGVKFRKKDVLALAGLDFNEITPFEVERLKNENEALKAAVQRLERAIRSINIATAMAMAGKEEVEC